MPVKHYFTFVDKKPTKKIDIELKKKEQRLAENLYSFFKYKNNKKKKLQKKKYINYFYLLFTYSNTALLLKFNKSYDFGPLNRLRLFISNIIRLYSQLLCL